MAHRTATAFVATPARRGACATHLTPDRLSYYLNSVGLHALYAGDLATARDFLTLPTRHYRDVGDMRNLAIGLRNLADCLGLLGLGGPAQETAAEALTSAIAVDDRQSVGDSRVYLGWLAALAGDTTAAEDHFTTADQIYLTRDGEHLYSQAGVWWAQWLARTGRRGPAQDLARRDAEICRENGGNEDLAQCDQVLGGLAAFAQATGDLDTAERYLAEAITIAVPRGLIPAHATALAARARLRAAQATTTGNTDLLVQGRDDADAARRLAVHHHLPWHELDALTAHTTLDDAEGTSHDWAAQAGQLHAQLAPPGLDPLATVERLVNDERPVTVERLAKAQKGQRRRRRR